MQALTISILLMLLTQNLAAATLMTVSFDSEEMRLVKETIARDLNKHKHVDLVIRKDSDYQEFLTAVRKNKPDFLALLDNKAVNFMKRMEKEKEADVAHIQAASTM